MIDSKGPTLKDKPVKYKEAFVELYNLKNYGQVHEIHGMIELEKMGVLTAINLHNLGTHQNFEILLILHNVYIISSDQNKFMFYINNYIN